MLFICCSIYWNVCHSSKQKMLPTIKSSDTVVGSCTHFQDGEKNRKHYVVQILALDY